MIDTINDYKIGNVKKEGGMYLFTFGETDNGMCFKDQNAYDHYPDRPCYVPECSAREDGVWGVGYDVVAEIGNTINEKVYYTRNDILSEARDYFAQYEDDYRENGIMSAKELADTVFDVIDWQTPDVYMMELSY